MAWTLQDILSALGPSEAAAATLPRNPALERQRMELDRQEYQRRLAQQEQQMQLAQQKEARMQQQGDARIQAILQTRAQPKPDPAMVIRTILGNQAGSGGNQYSIEGDASTPFDMSRANERIRGILAALSQGQAPQAGPNLPRMTATSLSPETGQDTGKTFALKGYGGQVGFNPQTGAFTNIGLPGQDKKTTSAAASISPEERIAKSAALAKAGAPATEIAAYWASQSPASQIPEGVTGDEALKYFDPGMATMAKKLANYEIPLPASRSKNYAEMVQAASAYDPSFDATKYNERMKLRQDFASGKNAANIRSLNTAVLHLDTLKKTADELSNSDYPAWNTMANFFQSQGGAGRQRAFENAATALSDELATAFKGTSGTDQEIKQWRRELSSNSSPEQFRAAIDTAAQLLLGRLNAVGDTWRSTFGDKAPPRPLLGKLSQKKLADMGIATSQFNIGGEVPPDQTGQVGIPPPTASPGQKTLDEETAAKFLNQAGGDNNRARALAKAAGYVF